jgi:hypothetical protein
MEDMDQNRLNDLLAFIQAEGRVCPMPDQWDHLWQMLPGRQRQGSSWHPPPPLILGAWWHSGANSKHARLVEHISYAAANDVLVPVDEYLRALPKDQWAYGDGTSSFQNKSDRGAMT